MLYPDWIMLRSGAMTMVSEVCSSSPGAAPGYFDRGEIAGNFEKVRTNDAIWCILLVTFTNKNV